MIQIIFETEICLLKKSFLKSQFIIHLQSFKTTSVYSVWASLQVAFALQHPPFRDHPVQHQAGKTNTIIPIKQNTQTYAPTPTGCREKIKLLKNANQTAY